MKKKCRPLSVLTTLSLLVRCLAKQTLEAKGAQPAGLLGHTAVFAPALNSILVVGGVGLERLINGVYQDSKRFAYRSARLQDDVYALNLQHGQWSSLSPLSEKRAYHSAFLVHHYLVRE